MSLSVHGDVAPTRVRELEAFVADHRTTERVFRDVDRLGVDYEIVAMDEYTLDLVVRLVDVTLVYDTT